MGFDEIICHGLEPWTVMMWWDMCPIDEVKDPSLKPIMRCKGNVDRKFTSRSEDLVDHVSLTFIVEYSIIFFGL